MARPAQNTTSPPVVLFYTDNGIGLGHLTRQAAVALRARGGFEPAFLTMSAAYTLPRQLGIPAEYFPAYGRLGISKKDWEPLVAQRLAEAIRLSGASAVVVDHVSPPRIFGSLRKRTKGVKFIWSRRGMWQPEKNREALRFSEDFDLIIEPSDLASPLDQGLTAARRGETVPTAPIILVDPEDHLPRNEARDELQIARSGRALLINLGDKDPAEVGKFIAHTRSVIDRLGEDVALFAPLHPLHGNGIPEIQGVTMAPVYPVSRYLNAFDGAISTAGYNSFHEIVSSGLPALFVPHRGAGIDDQKRRAEFAALSGRAQWASDVYDASFDVAVERMLRPSERYTAKQATALLGPTRGAEEFADIISEVVANAPSASNGRFPPNQSASHLIPDSVSPVSRDTLVIAVEDGDDALREFAASVSPRDIETMVVLIKSGDARPLYERGIVFETAMTEAEWSALGREDYSAYLQARIAGISRRYNAATHTALCTGQTVRKGHE